MTLITRLQSLIGEDEQERDIDPGTLSNPFTAHEEANELRSDQREELPEVVASVASDLKGLVSDWVNHERSCAWVWRNADKCNCHVSQLEAAIDRYCLGDKPHD